MQTRILTVMGLAASLLALGSCGGDETGDKDAARAADTSSKVELARARSCAQRVTVLFWPKGHPAIPAISFPSLPMPHVEIYGGSDPGYPTSAALAWAFTSPPGPSFPARSTKPDCLSDAPSGEIPHIEDALASGAAARLVCRLPGGAQIVNAESGPGRYRFAVLDPSAAVVADGVVGRDDSRLRYQPGSCKRTSPPKP
jgi:hypothetical protein